MVEQVSNLKTGVKYKDTLAGRVPIDWEITAFSEIAEINPKRTLKKGAVYPFVEMAALDSDSHRVKFTRLRKYEGGGTKFQSGDTLFARITPCTENGKTAFIDFLEEKEFGHGSTEFIVLGPKDNVNPKFIYYSTKWDKVRNIAIAKMEGTSGRQRVPSRVFTEDIFIPIPPFPEQKKIADVLTTVDEAVEKTTQIIEKTKKLKKGLMQKLFTEGIGHTEFKETKIGKIPEYWDVVQLSEILVGQKSRYGIYKERRLYGEGVPILKIGDVFQRNFYWGEKAKRVILSEKELLSNEVLVNDILIAVASVKQEGIGKVMYVSRLNEKTAFDHNLASIRTNSNKCNPKFLFYTLKSRIVRKKIESLLTKVGTTFLKASEIDKLLIPLPPLNEQRQVAEILLEVDAEIEKEQTYKSELEELKRGLMQVLLTGKLRVTV